MARVPDDEKKNLVVPVWPEYQVIVNAAENKEVRNTHCRSSSAVQIQTRVCICAQISSKN